MQLGQEKNIAENISSTDVRAHGKALTAPLHYCKNYALSEQISLGSLSTHVYMYTRIHTHGRVCV